MQHPLFGKDLLGPVAHLRALLVPLAGASSPARKVSVTIESHSSQ
jgi:hypothetical protein